MFPARPSLACSIYFLYNPDLRYLELGKVSALVEAYLTRALFVFTARHSDLVLALPPAAMAAQLSASDAESLGAAALAAVQGGAPYTPAAPLAAAPGLLRYLDLNFYVHGVSTMNYKRNFQPSDLLCPVMGRHHWRAITPELLKRLDADPAAPLALVPSVGAAAGVTDAPAAVRAAAAAQSAVETAAADAMLPGLLLTITGGPIAPYHCLTQHGQDLLRKGMTKFVRSVGPLAQRSLIGPDWVGEVRMQEEEHERAKAAKKAARAARRQAAEAALLEAALAETLAGAGTASSTVSGGAV